MIWHEYSSKGYLLWAMCVIGINQSSKSDRLGKFTIKKFFLDSLIFSRGPSPFPPGCREIWPLSVLEFFQLQVHGKLEMAVISAEMPLTSVCTSSSGLAALWLSGYAWLMEITLYFESRHPVPTIFSPEVMAYIGPPGLHVAEWAHMCTSICKQNLFLSLLRIWGQRSSKKPWKESSRLGSILVCAECYNRIQWIK